MKATHQWNRTQWYLLTVAFAQKLLGVQHQWNPIHMTGALPGVGHVGRLGGLKELGRVSHGTLSKLGGEWDSGLLDFSLACLAWNALERWKRMGMRDLAYSLFFNNLLQNRKHKTFKVAINWCICKDTIPIPGVKTIKQVKENLGALGWRLSSEEVLQLEYAAQESPRKMIQNIFLTR
ncbi:hypothetical protein Ahy_B10g103753 isoform D [Arachis hypogaea]|uniref:Uncharacterized protein n=1 Tax=Arachis hypogaea TaxID=3818 RepID=A0A444X469_ARAHY|nr:hypothetical protein Ahy_B10g103753 isoform D [Arachis hypogaea]